MFVGMVTLYADGGEVTNNNMNGIQILQGDVRDVLKTLPSESVNCVVTSPPY